MEKYAFISPCGLHRYSLTRVWDENKPMVMFIGLNPSRADHIINDPTITRCVNFAIRWGFGGLYFANLYSFRTPFPQILIENLPDAVGPVCNEWLLYMISHSDKVICSWGSWPFITDRAAEVLSLIKHPFCLGTNRDGQPKHPLYLKGNTPIQKYKL